MEKELLEHILDNAFLKLNKAVKNEEGRMVIPMRTASNRVSEQEMKQSFIDTFLNSVQCKKYSYSVETPTEKSYRLSENGKHTIIPLKPPKKGEGRRGNIDVVIFDGEKRVALIEFKANNSGLFEHGKDFLKLKCDPEHNVEALRFFVEVYTQTNESMLEDFSSKVYKNEFCSKDDNTVFIGYSLQHNEGGTHCKFVGDDNQRKVIKGQFTQ